MNEKEVLKELIAAIAANQKLNGIVDSEIEDSTRPMSDLDMFGSLTATEVLTDLEQTFEENYEINCELDVTLFFSKENRKGITKKMTHHTLTIKQVAENIYNQLIKRGK